jgi:hypothetical protein
MAEEILVDHKYTNEMTFVADETSLRILSKLEGRNISHGSTIFNGRVRILEFNKITDTDFPKAVTLVQHLARPSGRNYFESSYRDERIPMDTRANPLGAKIPYKGMLVVQTVLGNTENPNSIRPSGYLQFLDHSFVTPSAGLASNEAGIYKDVQARSLRGMKRDELVGLLKENISRLPTIEQQKFKNLLEFYEGRLLEGAQSGFAYGITLAQPYSQYTSYLTSLRNNDKNRATVIFTPSGVVKKNSPDSATIHILGLSDSSFPERAKAGHVYLVQIPDVSRHVFNILMALSDTPVVVAGDGALSGVLSLGKPFLMTTTGWNYKNRIEIGKLLKAKASPQLASIIEDVFIKGRLNQAALLTSYSDEMSRIIRTVADESRALLDSNLKIIGHLKKLIAEGKEIPAVLEVDGLRIAKADIPALAGRLSKLDFIQEMFSSQAKEKFDFEAFLDAFKPKVDDHQSYIKAYKPIEFMPDETKLPLFEKLYEYLDAETIYKVPPSKTHPKDSQFFLTANHFKNELINEGWLEDVKSKLLSEIEMKPLLESYILKEKIDFKEKIIPKINIPPNIFIEADCAADLKKLKH